MSSYTVIGNEVNANDSEFVVKISNTTSNISDSENKMFDHDTMDAVALMTARSTYSDHSLPIHLR